jgi:hypothetical protein
VSHIRDDLHNLLEPDLASADDTGVDRVEVVTELDVVGRPGPVSLLDLLLPPHHFRSVHPLTGPLMIASHPTRGSVTLLQDESADGTA